MVYPESVGSLHGLHTGAFHGHVENENPDAPPDLFLQASSFPTYDAGVNGVTRQTVFDYSGVGDNHRWLLWSIRPSTKVPIFRTTASLEMWVHGGDLTVNGSAAHANCFIVVEPGQEVAISSGFGARVLTWIEGPAEPVEFDEPNKLFGY